MDADKMDRSSQPIYLTLDVPDGRMANKLNAFMDHQWDGFYTSQKRLQRFGGIVDAHPGSVYNVTYSGSPPKTQRFVMRSFNQDAGMMVRIHYPSAQSRNVLKNGKIVEFNMWDENERMYGQVRNVFCGENRYIGVKNILEFYLTPDCEITIQPRDAIQCNVRLEWTFAEFFAAGGTTKFVDRLAASIGIHASDIKIVSVYEGSVVVDYDLFVANDDPVELEALRNKHIELVASDSFKSSLGAPILNVVVNQTTVVSDGVVTMPGY